MTALANSVDQALSKLARMPTITGGRRVPSVRSSEVFGRTPTGIELPLNRKTTQQAIITLPISSLEPRQELVPVQGLQSYIVRPRRDPPDVARVQMRDGTVRLLIQEGHTRLGAAVMRGDTEMPVRVWEFQQTDTGSFAPVVRGRQRIYERIRDRPYTERLQHLALQLDGTSEGAIKGWETRRGHDATVLHGTHDKVVAAILRDGLVAGKSGVNWGTTDLKSAQIIAERRARASGGTPVILEVRIPADAVSKFHPVKFPANPTTGEAGYTHVTTTERIPPEWIRIHTPRVDGSNAVSVLYVPIVVNSSDPINLPDVADVSFPSMIGAVHTVKPRKKRKRVQYKGVSLSRAPMAFEVKVLSLAEIPPRLDAAVLELEHPDADLLAVLNGVAKYGTQQALLELLRQGAPDTILTAPPFCEDKVADLAASIEGDRVRDLHRTFDEHTANVSRRRLREARALALARELTSRWAPSILRRHAKRAVNMAFALGRAAVIEKYRRPREPVNLTYHDEEGKFTSKAGAMSAGNLWVDAVVMTAVMDTNTCDECEEVDGEVMELGDERQLELHPPYVKCAGGDRCRCVQIALLSDGSEIEVDEIPDDVYEVDE